MTITIIYTNFYLFDQKCEVVSVCGQIFKIYTFYFIPDQYFDWQIQRFEKETFDIISVYKKMVKNNMKYTKDDIYMICPT